MTRNVLEQNVKLYEKLFELHTLLQYACRWKQGGNLSETYCIQV
jgi:hypothetical protein